MQANLVEWLYNFSIEKHSVCLNCKQFRDAISYNCSIMFNTLGEYWDLSISKLAPSIVDLPRLEILPRRLGKRAHEFMFMGEPLVDDQGPYHDEPHHGTTLLHQKGAYHSPTCPLHTSQIF